MNEVKSLTPDELSWRCDPRSLEFQTTDDVNDLVGVIGQDRALDAIRFGIGVRQEGYNLYVLGPPGTGKRTIVRGFLEQQSGSAPSPP